MFVAGNAATPPLSLAVTQDIDLMTTFEGAHPALARALDHRGYKTLTPVQDSVLTPEAQGIDLLVSAQTGSGKTVAFGLSIAPTLLGDAERFSPAAEPMALAIAPTRELALQVARELEWLYGETGARVITCVGGMEMRKERRALSGGAHIVVGTPGRLRDHVERGFLDLSALKVVVLDEADEMLDLGFREDLEFILDAAPAERRTLMFSATVPRPIAMLAKRFQKDALRLSTVEEREQHVDIEYRAYAVAPSDRENAIINVLRFYESESAIVFCATREAVKHLSARLANRGFSVVALSGELSQAERTHALQAMRDGRARVCVATDVAARGIDLPNLNLVVHADLPTGRDTLLHRSGRTGRAGNKGISAVIVPYTRRRGAERLFIAAGIQVEWVRAPSVEEILSRDRQRIADEAAFGEDLEGDDLSLANELLERHGALKLASAFVRMQQARYPVPEELLGNVPNPKNEPPVERKDDFIGGVWFAVSLGRKQRAEPRWLLPLVCRAGHITKKDVGAIRIFENETRFEISPQMADRFIETILRHGTGEKSVTIVPVSDGDIPQGGDRADRGGKPAYKSGPRSGGRFEGKPGGYRAPAHRGQGPRSGDTRVEGGERTDRPARKPYAGDRSYVDAGPAGERAAPRGKDASFKKEAPFKKDGGFKKARKPAAAAAAKGKPGGWKKREA